MLPSQKVSVALETRTVKDQEVGTMAALSSPPATEEERANFKKLLLQMNGLSVAQQGATSSSNANTNTTNVVKGAFKTQTNATDDVAKDNDLEKQNSLKKKQRKRSGKKSNKASPTDSPSKAVQAKKDVSNETPAQEGDGQSSDKAQSAAESSTNAPNAFSKGPQAKRQSLTVKGWKGSQNSKVPKNVPQSDEPPKILLKDVENTKQSDSTTKLNSKDLRNVKDQRGASSRDIKKDKSALNIPHQENGEVLTLNVFERDPLVLLRAAVNFIKPRKKDLTLFYCIPCDKEFFELDRHLEKSKESHNFKWKCEMRRRTIDLLPELSQYHISLLDDLVSSIVNQHKLPDNEQNLAHNAWLSLNNIAQSKFKDCVVRWFGSQVNGIALSENKLMNMDLLVQNKEEAASSFLNFIAAVEQDENFEDVKRVVATNFAHANITHKASGLVIQLSLNNTGAYSTSKLIRDYISIDRRVQPLCIFFRVWGKMCGVDQGEIGSWQGHAFPIMVIHFLQQKNVLPVLHDMVENPEGNPEIYLDPKNLNDEWVCHNKDSPGKLMFEMLRYYAIEHDVEKHVVSITQFKPFLRTDTKWNAKRIAVIDPFQPKHNISRYISANMYDYVHSCLLSTTCVLGIPRSSAGPLFGYICPAPEAAFFHQTPYVLEEYLDVTNKIFDLVLRLDDSFTPQDLRKDNDQVVPDLIAHLSSSKVFRDLLNVMKVVPHLPRRSQPSPPERNAYLSWWVTPFQASCLTKQFRSDTFKIEFTVDLCTDKESPPIACTSCHKNGHLRGSCPDEVIPKMTLLPRPSEELKELLNQLCIQILESRSSGANELSLRNNIKEDLRMFLLQFYRDIDVHLFGSSLNGFGGRSSDIDMCITFKSNPTGEGLNFPFLVEEIQNFLKSHRNVLRPLAITTAKVPIVKFEYGTDFRNKHPIQVDMSLYNMLGIRNTDLLHAYSVIDPRVRPIVYMMKTLAKTTGIGDASRGSLSSYAYSLMSLYFLQQVEPPVIPVLQELHHPNAGCMVEILDGANVYFFRFGSLEELDEVWPHRMNNTSSLGELWLQLLQFYATEKFHKSQKVVCIRKKEPLYKFDKLWTSTNICIEDPFDLNHNLGSGLSKRMNIFIVKTFQKACKHFSSIPKLDKIPSLERYYFNETALSIGKPPSDRGCHFCHCIGHVQNDCPRRLMLQGRGPMRPNGRGAVPGNRGNNARPNFAFDNFNRGGNRRDQGRDNHPRGNRDQVRISNLPGVLPMQNIQHNMQHNAQHSVHHNVQHTVHHNVQHNAQQNMQQSRQQSRQQNMQQNVPHNVQHSMQHNVQSTGQPNVPTQSKPMNLQNHVVVGSMKPPGFPSVPPGYPVHGPPVRLVAPQMMQGPPPPFMLPRPPVQPFMWP